MRKITVMNEKDLNLNLYGKDLREFCNYDLRIVRQDTAYYFLSKHEKICFRVVDVPWLADRKRKLPITIVFCIADEIFAEILDLRSNEIF